MWRGVVDGEVEGEILRARRARGEVDALHLDELLLDDAQVVGGAPARGDHARLGLDAAAHLERLQQRVAQPAVSSDSGMWMVPAEIGFSR